MGGTTGQLPSTSATLLGRLRDPADAAAWVEFDRRYRDLIVRFLQARGLQKADAEDLAQDVLAKLVTGLRRFEYDAARGKFRGYLFRCVRGALADHTASRARHPVGPRDDRTAFDAVAGRRPQDDPLYAEFERDWVDHHYRLAVQRYREASDERGAALLDATLAGVPAREIGQTHGMSENAVHKAQQRLRERLRELIEEQVRDEECGDGRAS
ncbi:MAG: sigma-70 family RNA polymerase sigma factor [Planctomycetota bacterium]|nr:sigma-70 family RNA polymerase sigma factor [Planctomycetota bacterium]